MTETQPIPTNKISVYEEPGRGDVHDQDLSGLIASIQAVGLLHPIIVSEDGDNYRCIAGARRLAACRALLWETIPAVINQTGEDATHLAISAMENLERKQLNPLDEAFMCQNAISILLTSEKVAQAIGRTTAWVKQRRAILEWPDDCVQVLRDGKLSMSAIAPLAAIEHAEVRRMYLNTAIDNGATAHQTMIWLVDWRAARNGGQPTPTPQLPANGEPAVPQRPPEAPCLVCGKIHNLNVLAHLPLCPGCLSVVRQASAIKPQGDQSDEAASTASETEG